MLFLLSVSISLLSLLLLCITGLLAKKFFLGIVLYVNNYSKVRKCIFYKEYEI